LNRLEERRDLERIVLVVARLNDEDLVAALDRVLEHGFHRRADPPIGLVAPDDDPRVHHVERSVRRSVVDDEQIVGAVRRMARQRSADLLPFVVRESGDQGLHTSTAAPFRRIDSSIATIVRVTLQLNRPSVSGARAALTASTNSRHWFFSGSLGCTFGLTMSPSRTRSLNSPYESTMASGAATPRSKKRTGSTSLRSSNTTRRRLPTAK